MGKRVRHVEVLCDGSLPGDFSPRECCRAKSTMKQRKENSKTTQLAPTDTFVFALRVFIYFFSLLCILFFPFFFYFLFCLFFSFSFSFWNLVLASHARVKPSLQRVLPLSCETKYEKRMIVAFSFAKATRVHPLSIFLSIAAYVAFRRILKDVAPLSRYCPILSL